MSDTKDPTKKCEKQIDPEVGGEFDLPERCRRWQEDRQNDLED